MQVRVTYNIPEEMLPEFKTRVLDKFAEHFEFIEFDNPLSSKIATAFLEEEVLSILGNRGATTREIHDKLKKNSMFEALTYKKLQRTLVGLAISNKIKVEKTNGGPKGTFNMYYKI